MMYNKGRANISADLIYKAKLSLNILKYRPVTCIKPHQKIILKLTAYLPQIK